MASQAACPDSRDHQEANGTACSCGVIELRNRSFVCVLVLTFASSLHDRGRRVTGSSHPGQASQTRFTRAPCLVVGCLDFVLIIRLAQVDNLALMERQQFKSLRLLV